MIEDFDELLEIIITLITLLFLCGFFLYLYRISLLNKKNSKKSYFIESKEYIKEIKSITSNFLLKYACALNIIVLVHEFIVAPFYNTYTTLAYTTLGVYSIKNFIKIILCTNIPIIICYIVTILVKYLIPSLFVRLKEKKDFVMNLLYNILLICIAIILLISFFHLINIEKKFYLIITSITLLIIAGAIYTKTADISADTAGKIDLALKEDDGGNPATLLDNSGDLIGDLFSIVCIFFILSIKNNSVPDIREMFSLFSLAVFFLKNFLKDKSIYYDRIFYVILLWNTLIYSYRSYKNGLSLNPFIIIISIALYYLINVITEWLILRFFNNKNNYKFGILVTGLKAFEISNLILLIILIFYCICDFILFKLNLKIQFFTSTLFFILFLNTTGAIIDMIGGIASKLNLEDERFTNDELDMKFNIIKNINKPLIGLIILSLFEIRIYNIIGTTVFIGLLSILINRLIINNIKFIRENYEKDSSRSLVLKKSNELSNLIIKNIVFFLPLFFICINLFKISLTNRFGIILLIYISSISSILGAVFDNNKKLTEKHLTKGSEVYKESIILDGLGDILKDIIAVIIPVIVLFILV